MKKEEFEKQLALLGIKAREDKRFGMSAIYNSTTNEVTYNPRLMSDKKMAEIYQYFAKKRD